MTNYNSMKPMDVGAPVLIPQGDTGNVPGSYGWLAREYWSRKSGKKFKSSSSNHPNFKSGYGGNNASFFSDIDVTCTLP